MWYKVKTTKQIVAPSGKEKTKTEYWLTDKDNFAEAGYAVAKQLDGIYDIEDVCAMKNLKPLGNTKYNENNKVFIVKIAVDMTNEDGLTKTQKYPIPFYANNNAELQKIIELYMKQGLEDMRISSVTETQFIIVE